MTWSDFKMDYVAFGSEPDEYSELGRTKEKTMVEERKANDYVIGFVLKRGDETLSTFIPRGDPLPPVNDLFSWVPVSLASGPDRYRTLKLISMINRERCLVWHKGGLEEWSTFEWAGAMCGEAGEAANVAKKIKRHDTDIKSSNTVPPAELLEKFKKEIGDTYLYLDLMAQREGLTLEECVVSAFNGVSEREGFPQRL